MKNLAHRSPALSQNGCEPLDSSGSQSRRLGAACGINMPVEFHGSDLWTLAALFGSAALITLLPGLIAYRQSPAQALRS